MTVYRSLEQQIRELWASRGLDVIEEHCESIGKGKFKWTIIAKQKALRPLDIIEKARALDQELKDTLHAMDESPVIQRVTKMTLAELEALPEQERRELQNAVLKAIQHAKLKAVRK